MLRITASRSSQQAMSYYTEGLSREDYYAGELESDGIWGGDGARRLGLSGAVDREAFAALAENRNPSTGEQLTARQNAERRVGYDFNFHCPKSVSLVHALTGDDAIMEAFRESVRETMADIERDVQTRVRLGGRQEDRTTGNLAWAEFVHRTARPVGGIPDPHLHAHCFVFNATFDHEEDRWKAGQFGDLKRDAPYYEACFHARLSHRLGDLGYAVRRERHGWELDGIPRELVEKFSQRTALIEEAARELGITDKSLMDGLGARTREAKRKDLTLDELRDEWESRLDAKDRDAVRGAAQRRKDREREAVTTRECLDHADAHFFERASVVPERRLIAEALWRGVGTVEVGDMHRAFGQRGYRRKERDGDRLCTTDEVLAEERAMVDWVARSRGTCKPLKEDAHEFRQESLSEEQRSAVRHILESVDRVTGIRGGAGTGKTSLMRETVSAIEETGRKVFVFAPSSEASRDVLRKEGFGSADTVARLLVTPEMREAVRGQVIWIDEAGMLGTRTMKRVLDLARAMDARVVLSGDTAQHRAVERGDSMRILQQHGGLACAELKTIRRQQGIYREAIQALEAREIETAFERLDELGAIRESESHERFDELADDFVAAVRREESVLVVSPTHREAELATTAIRERLREHAMLGKESGERRVPALRRLGWSEAQRADPANYVPGLHVEFVLNAKGFTKGGKWVVDECDDRSVVIRDRDGERAHLPLDQPERFQVCESRELPLSPGDRIQFRQNGKTREGDRIHNGSVQEVHGFDEDGNIVLANGRTVAADFGHLDHGYVVTSHASQGKTVDRVLVAQGSESWGASSIEQFYVSASRGRKSLRIYTDSREDLLEAVTGSSRRLSAVELLGPADPRRPQPPNVAARERERIVGAESPPLPPVAVPAMDALAPVEIAPLAKLPAVQVPALADAVGTAAPVPDALSPPQQPGRVGQPAPPALRPSLAPNAPSLLDMARAQELLAKYAGPRVVSPEEPTIGEERRRMLLDKYAGGRREDHGRERDEGPDRDRDRSE